MLLQVCWEILETFVVNIKVRKVVRLESNIELELLVFAQVTIVHWSDLLSNWESRKGVQTLQFKLMENTTTFFRLGGQF